MALTGRGRAVFASMLLMTFGQGAVADESGDPAVIASWLAEDIGGRGVVDSVQTVVEISADGRITGSGGCNRMTGSAEIGDRTIRFGPIAATRMACPPAVMDQEMKFFAALQATRAYEVDAERRKLTLLGEGGEALAVLSAR